MKRTIKIVIAVTIAILLVNICVGAIYTKFPLKYSEYIEKYSEEFDLDKYMVSGVIYAESRFDNKAHSGLARGLMQLTDATADWVSEKLDIDYDYDMAEEPETNIKMGCYYLSCLMDKYNNEETALAAYNAGMGNVAKWLADARYSSDGKTLYDMPYGETKKYVKRVKIFTYIYRRLYAKNF
jgi:soluble lytic murein transglycosylase